MSVCYVTAFLDINRGSWLNIFKRDFNSYLTSFLPYVKLFQENDTSNYEMIVYIDDKHYLKLLSVIPSNLPIRLVKINNTIMNDISPLWCKLDREEEIMKSDEYREIFKKRLHFPENHNPRYTLINHAKVDFMVNALDMTKSKFLCWTDFGYFKLPSNIPKKLLDISKLDKDRVNYTLINPITKKDRCLPYILHYAPEKIGGFFFFGNRDIIKKYQELYHKIHTWFQENNLVDDDQTLALQCYFENSNLMKLHMLGEWHKAHLYFQKS